ncbi:MAG: hypothetical protein CME24_06880 [Gemmatimonadetes bacterium]|nr:hypothetical protein [Gemmatimonadota bacterium]
MFAVLMSDHNGGSRWCVIRCDQIDTAHEQSGLDQVRTCCRPQIPRAPRDQNSQRRITLSYRRGTRVQSVSEAAVLAMMPPDRFAIRVLNAGEVADRAFTGGYSDGHALGFKFLGCFLDTLHGQGDGCPPRLSFRIRIEGPGVVVIAPW